MYDARKVKIFTSGILAALHRVAGAPLINIEGIFEVHY